MTSPVSVSSGDGSLRQLRTYDRRIQSLLSQLETQCNGVEALSPAVEDVIARCTSDLESTDRLLREELARNPAPALRASLYTFSESVTIQRRDLGRHMESRRRAQLLTTNRQRPAFKADPGADDGRSQAAAALQSEREGLSRVGRGLAEILELGMATHSTLNAQGQTIRGFSSRLGNFLENLGMSRNVIRMIERTERVDAAIVYIGIVAIGVLFGLMLWWRWFRHEVPVLTP
eukprot:TRINITY_DN49846_c0_g1_i1.p1 TRINITY_DN49846_c0_g1~~TRINITY_DN49846_c0_g1_i1.p1  ORF type:complete len:232 (-),score=19.87 TRINITY_DN49846_c0_g1_i1:21-716(-)